MVKVIISNVPKVNNIYITNVDTRCNLYKIHGYIDIEYNGLLIQNLNVLETSIICNIVKYKKTLVNSSQENYILPS